MQDVHHLLQRAKTLSVKTKKKIDSQIKRRSFHESTRRSLSIRRLSFQAPAINRKLVCVGDGNAGKTSLLTTFATGEFPSEYVPTIFDNYITMISLDNKAINLSLWDTAGQEDYDRLRPLSYNEADIALICYAIDDQASFSNVQSRWFPEVKHYMPHATVILVGCKLDLRNNYIKKINSVSFQQGEEMARLLGAALFMECSAKTRSGVNHVIEQATKLSLNTPKRARKTKNKCFYL